MGSYIAIGYACNQNCKGCPIKEKEKINFSLDELKMKIDEIAESSDKIVTLSGGEPTVHPAFLDIVNYMMEKDLYVTILTNAERFSDKTFVNEFYEKIKIDHIRIITTIHSSEVAVHEEQNGKPDSFTKTINGLNNLFMKGINITIKHCVSKMNYNNTEEFLSFIDDTFHPSVDIQLWGLDYSGLDRESAKKLFIPFREMQEKLEKAFDKYFSIYEKNGRKISVHNIPLCAADPIYWNLFVKPQDVEAYGKYYDPKNTLSDFRDDSGCYSQECKSCYVNEICMGTYKSAFEYFGDYIVNKIDEA